jgi:uncharacterized protein (TIGR03083 family)
LVEQLESLDDGQLATPLALFGMDLTIGSVARMRLSEHTLHTWDVAVVRDDATTLPTDAADDLIDQSAALAARAGRPNGRTPRVLVHTSDPERSLVLAVTEEAVTLTPGDDDTAGARLEIPAEAWIRLVAGRLDSAHVPAGVNADGVSLDDLREVFPGL